MVLDESGRGGWRGGCRVFVVWGCAGRVKLSSSYCVCSVGIPWNYGKRLDGCEVDRRG